MKKAFYKEVSKEEKITKTNGNESPSKHNNLLTKNKEPTLYLNLLKS